MIPPEPGHVPTAAHKFARLAWPWAPIGLLAVASCAQLLVDPRTRQLAGGTLRVAGSVVGLSLLIGVPLAILLVRTDARGRRAAAWLLTVLMLLPLYLQAAGWQAGFGLQGWFTLLAGGHTLLQGLPAAVWIHTAAAIPWVVVLVGLGLRFAEPDLEELAALELSPLGVLTRVTLRRAAPSIAIAAIWVALLAAGDMTVTNLFLVRTYAEEIYTQIALGGEPGVAPLGALPAALGTAWLLLGGLLLAAELARHGHHPSQRPAYVFQLGRLRALGTAAVWASVLLLAGVPIGNLIYKAGWQARHTAQGWERWWSAERLVEVVVGSPQRFAREFGWTLLLAALAAAAALAVGIPLAWWARRGGRRSVAAWTLTAGCLALPGPIIGLSIIWLFQRLRLTPGRVLVRPHDPGPAVGPMDSGPAAGDDRCLVRALDGSRRAARSGRGRRPLARADSAGHGAAGPAAGRRGCRLSGVCRGGGGPGRHDSGGPASRDDAADADLQPDP